MKVFNLLTIMFILSLNLFSRAEIISCSSKQSSYQCLVCNCYHETRGEPLIGKMAVAKTVLSRAESNFNFFPDSPCEVVYQPRQFSWTQDSYSNSIFTKNKIDRDSLQECRDVADQVLYEGGNGLIYFYNPDKVTPAWAKNTTSCGMAGAHLFRVPLGETCPKSLGSTVLSNYFSTPKQVPNSNRSGNR